MTTDTRRAAWNKTYNTYLNLNRGLIEARDHERDALERAVAAQEEQLLELPSPHFSAVIQKLELLWAGSQLEGLDSETAARLLVLEDLGDLILEQSQLLGVQLPA